LRLEDVASGYWTLPVKWSSSFVRRVAPITVVSVTPSGFRLGQYRWMGAPIDKSEGAVKDKNILGSAEAPLGLPERLRTKTLEISR
jgi:hypothetical protein